MEIEQRMHLLQSGWCKHARDWEPLFRAALYLPLLCLLAGNQPAAIC